MSCTVDWIQEGPLVKVTVSGTIDSVTSRRVSAAIATHVGIDGVEVVEVDTTAAELADDAGEQLFADLARRFAGAGQQLVIRDEALGGDRAAAPR